MRCSYNMIKKQMQGGDPSYRTSGEQHLLAAAEASESAVNTSQDSRSLRRKTGADERQVL